MLAPVAFTLTWMLVNRPKLTIAAGDVAPGVTGGAAGASPGRSGGTSGTWPSTATGVTTIKMSAATDAGPRIRRLRPASPARTEIMQGLDRRRFGAPLQAYHAARPSRPRG